MIQTMKLERPNNQDCQHLGLASIMRHCAEKRTLDGRKLTRLIGRWRGEEARTPTQPTEVSPSTHTLMPFIKCDHWDRILIELV